MAVDVATPSSILDEDWTTLGGDVPNDYENLDQVNLDDILEPVPKTGDPPATINPQVLSTAATPKASIEIEEVLRAALLDADGDNIVVGPVPKLEEYGPYSMSSPPTLHQSIEAPPTTSLHSFMPTQISNQFHRRSFSEPPIGIPSEDVHVYAMPLAPQPAITFTRSGVHLGTPKSHHGNRISMSKHPHIQAPYPAPGPQKQERYHLRRTQTQPLRPGPTSVPPPMQQTQYTPQPAMTLQQPLPGQMHRNPPVVTSRVCTPAPSPSQLHDSPAQMDRSSANWAMRERMRMVTIPVSEEELRNMITEAVKAALSDDGGGKSVKTEGVAEEPEGTAKL